MTLHTTSATGAPYTPNAAPTLLREIGRWSLVAVVVNSVIGSGVFGLPSTVAALVGAWSPLAVLIAGACIFTIVLAFAEVGSRFDQAGGPYLYTSRAFGSAMGFQIGWLHLWTRFLSGAAVLNVLVNYMGAIFPGVGSGIGRAVLMSGTMLLVTVLNVIGVRQASWTVNLFTVAKLLPLVLLGIVGLVAFDGDVAATQRVPEMKWTDAVLLLVFAYGGFESSVVAASESRDPKRDTAFSLAVGMGLITLIYLLVQLAVVGVLPDAGASTTPVASAFGVVFGRIGTTLGSLAVIVSVYGWLIGAALMNPRIIYSMADRGELPVALSRVHPQWRTPHVAIVVSSVVMLAAGLYGSFAQMATFGAIVRLGIYLVVCASLIALRRKEGHAPFALIGGGALAVIGMAFCVWMLSTRSFAQAWPLVAIVAVGFLLFEMGRRRHG